MKIYYWAGVVVGLTIFLWPNFYIYKLNKFTEAELEKLSPRYKGINKAYLKHGLWGAIIFIPLLVIVIYVLLNFEFERRMQIMSAIIVMAFSEASIFFGSFAAKTGVYPTTKYFGSKTRYAYDEYNEIVRYARLQVYISVGVGIISMAGAVLIMLW